MWVLADRYVIQEKYPPKSGGMAEVYQAIDTGEDGKRVAIKLFKGELDSNPIFALAYDKEYRALSRLSHPHIVKWLDGGVDGKTRRRFFVMDWLEDSLEDRLSSLNCPGWDSFFEDVGRDVLDALVYAYSRHVLHRDVKPANVMFSADGAIQLVDFSIAKIKEYFVGGHTLAGFRTVPYAPPEADSGVYTDSRDVYGWGALAVACLASRSLSNYADLNECLSEADIPPDVYELLTRCVSDTPTLRPQNVVELANELGPLMQDRLRAQTPRLTIHFTLTQHARSWVSTLSLEGGSAEAFVEADLADGCSARPWVVKNAATGETAPGVELTSARVRYRCAVAGGAITVIQAIPTEFARNQWSLDGEFRVEMDFKAGPPRVRSEAHAAVTALLEGIEEFAARRRERELVERAERPFRVWDSVLKAKLELERIEEAPMPFTSNQRDGGRATFQLVNEPAAAEVGQVRLVRMGGRIVASGELTRISDASATLLLEGGTESFPHGRGELVLDSRASRAAIRRQREALEVFRLDKATKAGARQLLIEPETAAPPMIPTDLLPGTDGLDPDKVEAVAKALGTRDCLVVQGPPGTGKTTFIVAVIASHLSRNPAFRILLSAQTHVAVDNALARLREHLPSANCIRIAGYQTSRVAASSQDILLSNKAREWVKAVEERTDVYLADWAVRQGLRAEDVALGLAVSRFRLAKRQHDAAVALCERLESQLHQPEATAPRADGEELPTPDELAADLLVADKRRKELKRTLQDQRKLLRKLDESLEHDTDEELSVWEDVLLGETAQAKQCKQVLEILEDWRLRLQNAPDFFAALMAEAQVVAGTCVGIAAAPGIDAMEFDLAIVDEASKATVTETMVPLERARSWIIVGDTRQLPPFVDAGLSREAVLQRLDLTAEDLKESLLSRFEATLPAACVVRLIHQRRMVREIGELVSLCFYDGALKHLAAHDTEWLRLMLPRPVTWISTSALPLRHETRAGTSYFNALEAEVIGGFLKGLSRLTLNAGRRLDVAVLTGYMAQRGYVERTLAATHSGSSGLSIEVNTVDAFQGREVDVALYSLTRSNAKGSLGFLSDNPRLNVALSRARLGLVIIGDMSFVQGAEGENPFLQVLRHIESVPHDCAIEVRKP